MLKFKKFTEKHLKFIQKYTKLSPYYVCDLSAGVILMWDDVFNVSFAEHDQTLILKCNFKNKKPVFFLPIGKNFDGALTEIEHYTVENGLPLNFMCVEEEQLPAIKERYGDISAEYDRDFSDYLYDYEKLLNLVGKKFSGQRNHINAFKKAYPQAVFKRLLKKDLPRVYEFLKEYKKEHRGGGRIERSEYKNTLKLVDKLFSAEFEGGYMEVDGKMVSFSIGEYAGNTLIIHIEKALTSYRGVYPTTFNSFLKLCKKDGISFINREDDSGDLGLRTSKTQYQPERLVHKYFIEVKKPMKIARPPVLKGERVELSRLTPEDKEFYFKLYTAVNLNKYWGYDYKKDVVNPTPDAFFDMQKRDFKNKNNLCLAIRDKKTKQPMGEVVLHNFGYDNTVEVGVRILKKFQGNGYAKESVKLISEYALSKLNLKPVAKCYLQNEKSFIALKSAGFIVENKDNKFYYLAYGK
ncbi:MAG: GNAT family N-acetyltransferase [Clostridia bacterium]|nr:GNAT family N-acetyltransferase [Clostridia bacterium]